MKDNAADEKFVKDQREKNENERDQELEDIKTLLSTKAGQRFFKRFYKEGKINDVSMTGNSWTFFNEGHRNFAKSIFSDVCEVAPQLAGRIITELLLESKESDNE